MTRQPVDRSGESAASRSEPLLEPLSQAADAGPSASVAGCVLVFVDQAAEDVTAS